MEKLTKLKDGSSKNVIKENILKIKELFPEIITDEALNLVALKELFGEFENDTEKYSFNWPGKKNAIKIAQNQTSGTFRVCTKKSIDFENAKNIFIEGDNLESLKLLQKSYHKKIKMIFIDPPYNTGNEFLYPDKFQDNLETYLAYSGQKDNEGIKFSTNTETSGRYHTNWLNMMYPRLKIARNLLKDDGVIFISIDDSEQANLKKICDEIFGEENFRSLIAWQKKYSVSNNFKGIASIRDHILVYAKSDKFENSLFPRTDESISRYSNPDNDTRGPWKAVDYWNQASPNERPNLCYDIINPHTGIKVLQTNKAWKYSREVHEEHVRDNSIWWGEKGENSVPALKRFLSEVKDGMIPHNWWPHEDAGHTDEAKKKLDKLMGKPSFDTPKPVRLIEKMIQISNLSDADIVLDFFAGSCSTAEAVLSKNEKENTNCQFIMIQLPEKCKVGSKAYDSGYRSISDIGIERIKKVIERDSVKTGLKVFFLDTSNIKSWDGTGEQLENTLFSTVDNIKSDRSDQDLLYEILLKYGLSLTVPIELHKVAGKVVYSVGYGAILVCLESDLSFEAIEAIGELKMEINPSTVRVIFKDSGFKDDSVKSNSIQILKQYGIDDVKSL